MRPQVFRKRLEGRVDDMKLPRDVLEHGALLSGQLAWEEEPMIMRTSTSLAARAHPETVAQFIRGTGTTPHNPVVRITPAMLSSA